MRSHRVVLAFSAGALALATAVVGVPASAEAAPATPATPTPWQPYRSTGFEDQAGDVCAFALKGTPVRDEEEFRTTEFYADGSPKVQEYRGALTFRYTNEATGRSVVRNLAGTSYFNFRQDGSLAVLGTGHLGITVHAHNTGYPQGEWVLSGGFTFVVSATGHDTVNLLWGSRANICRQLS
jgi:hypothetical protein